MEEHTRKVILHDNNILTDIPWDAESMYILFTIVTLHVHSQRLWSIAKIASLISNLHCSYGTLSRWQVIDSVKFVLYSRKLCKCVS